jgi:hypothetical protein
MEKPLKKETKFQWNEVCQKGLDTLKKEIMTVPVFIFLDWKKEFHVHVYASSISLGTTQSQPGEGDMDHSIVFASRSLSIVEKYYTTAE